MSVSKWRYNEHCDGEPCPGDCDFCQGYDWLYEDEDIPTKAGDINAEGKEIEQDGDVTWMPSEEK